MSLFVERGSTAEIAHSRSQLAGMLFQFLVGEVELAGAVDQLAAGDDLEAGVLFVTSGHHFEMSADQDQNSVREVGIEQPTQIATVDRVGFMSCHASRVPQRGSRQSDCAAPVAVSRVDRAERS